MTPLYAHRLSRLATPGRAFWLRSLFHPYSALKNEVRPSVGYFDDLIPKYKPCWDYRTDDGKNIDIKRLSDEALVRIYECQLETDRTALLTAAAATTIGVPLLALILGWLLLWIARGFRQNAPG